MAAHVVAVGGTEDGAQQPGEAGVEVVATEFDEAAGAFLSGAGDPSIAEHAQVMTEGGLGDRHAKFAPPAFTAIGEHPHQADPDGVVEGPQHVDQGDLVRVGMSCLSHGAHATLFDVSRTSNIGVTVNARPCTDLTAHVVVVTGAGSGIGRATAHAFAHAGARVLGVGRRKDALAETAAGHPAIAVHPADLNEPSAPQEVVDAAVDRWGQLDVLVNNAGATRIMPLAHTTAAGITALFDLNVVAPSLLAHAALPHLRRSRGSIVNVSSTYGHRPLPGAAHYAASKAALEQLTRSWAAELAAGGIRVNALAPGPTESPALAAAGLSDATIEEIKREEAARIPLGRRGDPEEVAAWILRLADPASTWLTGQVLTVDGGLELT